MLSYMALNPLLRAAVRIGTTDGSILSLKIARLLRCQSQSSTRTEPTAPQIRAYKESLQVLNGVALADETLLQVAKCQ